MIITGLNQNKTFSLQLTPRELSIFISALDYTLIGIEDSGVIPESMVPQSAKNKPDPDEEEMLKDARQARLLKDQLVASLPGWREL